MSARESCVTSFEVLCGLTDAGVFILTCIENVGLNVRIQKNKAKTKRTIRGGGLICYRHCITESLLSWEKEILPQTHKQHGGVFCLQNRCGFKGYTIYLEMKINEYTLNTTRFILTHAFTIASLR